jgi:hypothetical protein
VGFPGIQGRSAVLSNSSWTAIETGPARPLLTLERVRAAKQGNSPDRAEQRHPVPQAKLELIDDDAVSVGSLVLYRPPGDKRTYPCRVDKLDGTRAYSSRSSQPARAGLIWPTSHLRNSVRPLNSDSFHQWQAAPNEFSSRLTYRPIP